MVQQTRCNQQNRHACSKTEKSYMIWIPHPPKVSPKTRLGIWFQRNGALKLKKTQEEPSFRLLEYQIYLNTKLTSCLSMDPSGSYSTPSRQTQHTAFWTRSMPSLPEGLSCLHTYHTRLEPYATKQKLQQTKIKKKISEIP